MLQRARTAGKTVFLSSHLLSEIELVCDRIGILHRGRLARVGRTSDLLESSDQCEVVARGIPGDTLPQAISEDGTARFIVPKTAQRETIEQVWSLGGEIVRVTPVKRSLEDMFIELTGESTGEGRRSMQSSMADGRRSMAGEQFRVGGAGSQQDAQASASGDGPRGDA